MKHHGQTRQAIRSAGDLPKQTRAHGRTLAALMSRSLLALLSLALLACHRPVDGRDADVQPEPSTHADPAEQNIIRGRVLADGAPLVGTRVSFATNANTSETDENGAFELTLTDDFAHAPAIYLSLTTAEGRRSSRVLRNPGRPLSLTFHVADPPRVELHAADPRDQAWLDTHAWAMREGVQWVDDKGDYAAHLAQWDRVAEAIAAEPDRYRRELMIAAQFGIGGGEPEHGVERSAIARAALDELGLEDPRWSIYPSALPAAIYESGRWLELAPQLDRLISEHPQPQVAALIALERYIETSAEGPPELAAAIWTRWLERPALSRTWFGPTMASVGPKRLLAPGQALPNACVEDLAGGPLCLADLRGRMVVLEIWTITCDGCRQAVAELRAAHAALAGDGAPLFVSISAWDEPDALASFLRDEPMPWRHGWIRESERDAFAQALGFQAVPTLILIDAEGTILASSPELRADNLIDQVATIRRAID